MSLLGIKRLLCEYENSTKNHKPYSPEDTLSINELLKISYSITDEFIKMCHTLSSYKANRYILNSNIQDWNIKNTTNLRDMTTKISISFTDLKCLAEFIDMF